MTIELATAAFSAPFRLTWRALPGMRDRKWGRIINVTSNWGVTGTVHRVDYAARVPSESYRDDRTRTAAIMCIGERK